MQFLRRRTKSKEEELVGLYSDKTSNLLPHAEDVGSPVCDTLTELASDTAQRATTHSTSPFWRNPAAKKFVRVASHRISSHSDPCEESDDADIKNVLVTPAENATADEHSHSCLQSPRLDEVCSSQMPSPPPPPLCAVPVDDSLFYVKPPVPGISVIKMHG